MNTILITGICSQANEIGELGSTRYKVNYDVNIWASQEGEQIQLITYFTQTLDGYVDLWRIAKEKAAHYFKNDLFQDGAYTQFLDHLHPIS